MELNKQEILDAIENSYSWIEELKDELEGYHVKQAYYELELEKFNPSRLKKLINKRASILIDYRKIKKEIDFLSKSEGYKSNYIIYRLHSLYCKLIKKNRNLQHTNREIINQNKKTLEYICGTT